MEIKYKIIAINTEEHSVTVRFYTDKITEEMLQGRTDYHITIWDTPMPTGEEFHNLILRNAPVNFFEIKHKILEEHPSIEIPNEIHSLVGKEHTAVVDYIIQNRPTVRRKK